MPKGSCHSFPLLKTRLFRKRHFKESHIIWYDTQFLKIDFVPLKIYTIEMMSFWQDKTCLKSADSDSVRKYVYSGGLDLSQEVLWVSVGQRAAKLWFVKLCEWSHRPGLEPGLTVFRWTPVERQVFFWSPTLTACSFTVLWLTETYNTSLERSNLFYWHSV